MSSAVEEDYESLYHAVRNGEGQYPIWPKGSRLPAGWHDAGKSGTKAECLAYIDGAWEDMSPAPLRERMRSAKAENR
jgi:MbtH protein